MNALTVSAFFACVLVGPVWTPNKGADEPPKWTKVEAPLKLGRVGMNYVSVEGSFGPQVQKTGSSLRMHLLRTSLEASEAALCPYSHLHKLCNGSDSNGYCHPLRVSSLRCLNQ
jgi:hypothetical protein